MNLSHDTIAVTPANFAEFRYKLIYTVGNIFAKPRYSLVFMLARFGTFRRIYAFVSSLFQATNRIISARTTDDNASSLFTDLDTAKVTNILKSDGVCAGLKLPQPFLLELLQYLAEQNCYAGGESNLGFKISQKNLLDRAFDRSFYVARYFNISSTPQIIQLANDPKLQTIAKAYIGQQAKYTGSSLFWTFPVEGVSQDKDQQKFRYFHYDIDDFAGLRFCFYLTNVSLEDGPHICIRGSHFKKSIFHLLNYFSRIQTQEDLAKLYEPDKFLTLTGDSGTGFMEDTFCYHKGQPPQNQARLFLQLHFAVNNYNQSRYLDSRDPDTLKSFLTLGS